MTGTVIAVVGFVAALVLCIVIHELGHYLVAKRYGIHCRQFFVGFGPTLWSTQRGETEFGVKALPLGGFVRISGMTADDNPDGVPAERLYANAPRWQRFLVVGMGPATHLGLAAILTWGALSLGTLPALTPDYQPVLSTEIGVADGTQAQAAGLRDGDRIVEVDGQAIEQFGDLEQVLGAAEGDSLAVVVERDGQREAITVAPWEGPPLGVVARDVVFVEGGALPALRGVFSGPYALHQQAGATFGALGRLVSPEFWQTRFTDPASDEARSGPVSLVGAGQVFVSMGEAGAIAPILLLLGSLNVALMILNLLPLPPFDGGTLAMTVVEAVRSRLSGDDRYLDPARLWPLTAAVLVLVVVIAGSLIYADVALPLFG